MDNSDVENKTISLTERTKRLAIAFCNVYGVLLVGYFILRFVFGDNFWPIAFVSVWLNWILLAAFVLLPLVIVAKRWGPAVLLGIGVLAFLVLFGGLFLPGKAVGDHSGSDHLPVFTELVFVGDH